ncbi:hypothetical protein [Sporisorium scitamineum]|uniref:Uncharacterized protein n=1 Tax=Sporisorium scitamineum TaxID=49012 RepID=A0A0F7S6S5_9BASI|nr:hypothetical protein [Sporisorium scitamineum]
MSADPINIQPTQAAIHYLASTTLQQHHTDDFMTSA